MAKKNDVNVEVSKANVQIEVTGKFERQSKNAPIKNLENALSKIGTGTGHEHRLTNGQYAIRTSDGGRILFQYNESRSIATLLGYDSSHDYNKLLRAG
jgi:hypothetical protein